MLSIRQAKASFFDRAAVTKAIDRAAVRHLSRGGALVRTRARSSMRRRKKISAAGTPPSAHVGLVKEKLFFSYDQRTRSVVVGPALLNKPDRALLARLEFGGTTSVRTIQVAARNKSGRLKKTKSGDLVYETRRSSRAESRTVTYRPRPFMGPALAAEAPKLSKLWRNAVRP